MVSQRGGAGGGELYTPAVKVVSHPVLPGCEHYARIFKGLAGETPALSCH